MYFIPIFRLFLFIIEWNSMRSQLVERVNELETRRQFLLTYVSRVTERSHAKVDINITAEQYQKVTAEFDEQMKTIESLITTLEEQVTQIKSGELWKVGGFLSCKIFLKACLQNLQGPMKYNLSSN